MGVCCENGLLLAALSSLFFSVCSVTAKFLEGLHPLQLSWFSFFGILIISAVPAFLHQEPFLPRGYRKLLFSRSIAGTVFLFSSFYSVQLIPLGDASVLFYTAPAFTVILAKWFLKEPWSPLTFALALALMVCVIMVMKPTFISGDAEISKVYILGVAMAVLASICDSLGNITLRSLRGLHYSVIMFNYGFLSLIQVTLISLFSSKWEFVDLSQLVLLSILVVSNAGEQILMTYALSLEKAGPVAIVQATDIVYGYTSQVIFFREKLDFWSMFGACMVVVLIVFTSVLKKREKSSEFII